MKTIVRTLLALFVVSVAVAWASEGDLESMRSVPAPEMAQPEVVQPEAETADEELTAEDLENMDPEVVEAGACCFAECFEQKMACQSACDFLDSVCMDACRQQFEACKVHC